MPRIASKKDTSKTMPKPRQRKANGYKFPEKLPEGEILKDVAKKEWILGPSIGKGGFGEIYCASAFGEKVTNHPFVIKIEPHENGPLFVEKNFYIKIARPEDVDSWKKENGVKTLGIPTFYGSGSHEFKKDKYRFIVIERYGNDLWNLFLKNKRIFPVAAVCKCAIQIIDVLHYIHDKGYIHGDIKGANLLLGLKKGTENNVFLVDFGLACKYNTKEFKADPKKAHNGTIEYTSRDWHIGVPTRRGDMEILGYNLLHWLGSTLPWEPNIKIPEKVYEKKRELMENVKDYMNTNYSGIPKVIIQYLNYVANLRHDEAPDYEYCKGLFEKELKSFSGGSNGKLDFTTNITSALKLESPAKKTSSAVKTSTPGKKTKLDVKADTPRKKGKTTVKSESSAKKTPVAKMKANAKTEKEPEYSTPIQSFGVKRKSSARLDSDSEDDVFLTPLSPRMFRSSTSRNTPSTPVSEKPTAKPKSNQKPAEKPSWRDAPTALASNIAKAGEYVRKTKLPVKKKKTK